jgi:hypothetical protein
VSFFERAWYSAADQYGRDRSEAYGRWAKLGAFLGVLGIVVLIFGIAYVSRGPWG